MSWSLATVLIVFLVAIIASGALLYKGRKSLPNLETHSGRRAWALIALLGGCAVFTMFAAVGVFLVREDIKMSFWLAVIAHVQILVGITTLGALLVRRSLKVSRNGIEMMDHEVRSDLQKILATADENQN